MEYAFSTCRLDTTAYVLFRDGEELHVEPQVFDLLVLLAESGGSLVTYDQLIERVWGGRIVSDATVAARISGARSAVGDDGRRQTVIRTVPRRGVQLAVPVNAEGAAASAAGPAPYAYGPVRIAQSHDGTGIAWSSLGTSGPPLIRAGHWLTHLELDRESPVQAPLTDRLARGRRLAMYDPRGTGLSDRDCPPVTLEDFAADLAAVINATGYDRVSIYAPSQAAAVSCLYAARHPERVERMVFYGGFAQGPDVRDSAREKAMAEAATAMILQGWGRPENAFMRSFSTLFVPGATPEQIEDFIRRQAASATPERAVEYRRAFAGFDVTDILPQVRAPVLVAHGRDDAVHTCEQAKLFARLLPNAELLLTDSSNHILLPQEPAFERLMTAIDAFLA